MTDAAWALEDGGVILFALIVFAAYWIGHSHGWRECYNATRPLTRAERDWFAAERPEGENPNV